MITVTRGVARKKFLFFRKRPSLINILDLSPVYQKNTRKKYFFLRHCLKSDSGRLLPTESLVTEKKYRMRDIESTSWQLLHDVLSSHANKRFWNWKKNNLEVFNQTWSQSYQTLISSFFWFSLLKYRQYFLMLQRLKLNNEKQKTNLHFAKKKVW